MVLHHRLLTLPCSNLSLRSIIIVGVGSENFENMNALDGDDRPFAVRDIVQVLPSETNVYHSYTQDLMQRSSFLSDNFAATLCFSPQRF